MVNHQREKMKSAYIKQLERHALEHAQSQSTPDMMPTFSLEQRFLQWYKALPEATRNRPFSMHEFELALGTQGRHLSPVLLRLGWARWRKWDAKGHYHRYWTFNPHAREFSE